MKITYLVTCSTETDTLRNLLGVLCPVVGDDELLILRDDAKHSVETVDIIRGYENLPSLRYYTHSLNNDYGGHKNFGIERATGDFIFQIDGDELPPEALLGENLHALLENNPEIEAYAVPRLNDFKGVTEAHAKQWGWALTYNARPSLKDRAMGPLVNWPDYQFRIFKRDYPRIQFKNRLHERIDGYKTIVGLPQEAEYA